MLSHAPLVSLAFAADESNSCASQQAQPPLTDAQRLKAIESYALIAASYPVSTHRAKEENTRPQNPANQTSLRLSLRIQDTFRHYVRLQLPRDSDVTPTSEKRRPSRELRNMFADYDLTTSKAT